MANRKTPVKGKVVRFTSRNMPEDLYVALRMEAVRQRTTAEAVVNEAIRIGLQKMGAIPKG